MRQDTKKTAKFQAVGGHKTSLSITCNELSKNEQIMLYYLVHHFTTRKKSLINFLEVSSVHLEHGFALSEEILTGKKRKHKHQRSRKYFKALQGLIKHGIIERTNSYYYESEGSPKNKCKEIRFTQEFIQSENAIDLIRSLVKHQRARTNNKIRRNADSKVRRLSLKKDVHIHSIINEKISPKFIESRFVRYSDIYESLNENVYLVVIDGKVLDNPLTMDKALEIAEEKNLDVFYRVSKKILILDKPDFLTTKLFELRLVYSIMLENIITKNFFPASISKTNKRLTTFFTVFPNELLKLDLVRFNKKPLLTFDIKNSQFTILANIMMSYRSYVLSNGEQCDKLCKVLEQEQEYIPALEQSFFHLLDGIGNFKPDVIRFINAAFDGNLYEQIVKIHNLSSSSSMTKKEAKTGMFLVAFAKHQHNPPLKAKIKKAYPNVIKFIDTFKKIKPCKDKQNFAVWLQRIEATICVDNVLLSLQSKYPILTRHDSFSTMQIDEESTKLFKNDLEKILDTFLQGYKLKRERYSNNDTKL